jgi:alkyl hydroperoxide reductase subunit AhpC
LKSYEGKNVQILGLSCDPIPALKTWAQGMGGVGYPLLSDFHPHGKVSQALGIYNAEGGFPLRSVVVIDPQGVVRAHHTYPAGQLPVPDEVLAEIGKMQ